MIALNECQFVVHTHCLQSLFIIIIIIVVVVVVVVCSEAIVRRIVESCGIREQSRQWTLPASLAPLVPLSFALISGALLGSQLQHGDDIDHERGRLLAAAPRDAALLIEPALLVVESADDNVR
jgi:hypothetical protein